MKMMSKAFAAAVIAAASTGSAMAAGQSPGYVGADVGARFGSGDNSIARAYAGYTLGSGAMFGLEQVHALEVMAFTSRADTSRYYLSGELYGGERVRTNGIGLNWATSTKLTDTLSLTSRLGANHAWSTVRYRGDAFDSSYQRNAITVGLGLAYKVAPNVSLTVDVTYMPLRITPYERKSAPMLGTGLRYDF